MPAISPPMRNWGYRRFWVAEHHNMTGIASAATVGRDRPHRGGAPNIRVGAGGIMLPNHAPIVIAEQFGTLPRLYPGRIDLGLGRAPGTDQLTVRALRRSLRIPDNFPQDVLELQAFLRRPVPNQRVQAVPAAGTEVPLSILGSSTYGAHARRGARPALRLRLAFRARPVDAGARDLSQPASKPSEQLARPYAMVGVNIIAADTDAEAKRLATTQQMSFTNMFRGDARAEPAADRRHRDLLVAGREEQAMGMLARSIMARRTPFARASTRWSRKPAPTN